MSALGLLGLIAILLPLSAALSTGLALALGIVLSERTIDGITRASFSGSLLACLGVDVLVALQPGTTVTLAHWLVLPTYLMEARLVFDAPAAVLMTLTALLGGLIGAVSAPYLHRDPGYRRFFVLLPLFASGMMAIAAADTLELLYAGWEVVGLSSALLIAYFHQRDAPARHGLRAFAVYRVCDVALLCAAVLHHREDTPAVVVAVLLVVAAMGKAAAFPFTGWLPRAMEGPTPSSAIFYGALSIHAGPFLLIRSWTMLQDIPLARALLVGIGLLSALHASMVGRVQTDIKSALGYASAMQVGLIMVEIGLGFPQLALVHLACHALLRTWQLLRAPSLLHDRRRGGGGSPRGIPWERLLPPSLRRWTYRLALERWFVDDLAANRLLGGLTRALRMFDAADRRWLAPVAALAVGVALLCGVSGETGAAAASGSWPILDAVSRPRLGVTVIGLAAALLVLPKRHRAARPIVALSVLAAVDLCLVTAPAGPAQGALFALHCALAVAALPSGPARRLAVSWLGVAAVCGLLGSLLGGATGAALLLLAAAIAMGVPPFHSWVVGAYVLAPTTIAVALVAPMPALALIAREPLALGGASAAIAGGLAAAALVAAALVLVQEELARAVALLTASVQAVVLIALLDTDSVGHLGGLMMWTVTGLALLGLGLVAAALRARTGAVRVDRKSGHLDAAPTFGGLFLLFGLAAVGAPGTADFASEELVLHGSLARDPMLLLLLVSAVSMQGYAALHLFFRAFYGAPSRQPLVDALPRERVALVGMAILLVVTGLIPQLLVDMLR